MKSRKIAALTLLMAHAWLAWTGSVAAQPITQYQANYEAIGGWTSSVPAAVEDLIRILETVGGSYCQTVQQPPDGYTQRKCSYLDHDPNERRFRMLQVVDVVHRGSQTLHTETILGGTYQIRGPWLMTRIKGPPRSCPAQLKPGHPIHPISGGKSLREDLGVGRIGGQPLVALYDTMSLPPQSAPAAASAAALAAHASTSFGGFWRGNLHKRLLLQTDAAQALRSVLATRDDGSWQGFKRDDTGIWQPDADVLDRLQQITGGWRYTDMAAQSEELYDTEGRLLSVAYANGNRLSYGYSTAGDGTPEPGLLTGLQDQTGRSVSFSYEWPAGAPRARIRQITSDAGSTFIAYDAGGNLSLITDPAGKTRQYLYERSDLPWAVTGIVDERGARLATYGYDPFGLAVETQWAGGADHYTAAYATPPKWDTTDTYDAATNILWRDHHWVAPTGLTLTDPNGAVSDISTTVINDKVYLSGRSQPAGAGCSASTSSQAFDVNGILSRRDDFNGTRSCYANDLQRKLPITSVEGLAQTDDCGSATQASSLPAPSRMTSTEWHPDWPLPVRQAGPNLLTTWIYNGQSDPFNANQIASCAATAAALPDGKPLPLLCKRVAQATLDHNGTKRFALAGQAAVPGDPNGVDPNYASVSLLLHVDGSSNAAGLVDSSGNAYTVSAFGNASVSSSAARYGSGGLALDGSQGTYVTASSAALDLGANDFTVEAWVRLNAYGNFATLMGNYGQGGRGASRS